MLPRWTLDQTFDNLAEYGYDGVELRCRFNPEDPEAEPAFWGRHLTDVSPDNIAEKADNIRAASERSGVTVAALAPNVLMDDRETIEKIFRGAVTIDGDNPPLIRIGAPRHDRNEPYQPQFDAAREGYANLIPLAADIGVKMVYEIHVGTVAVSASRAWELLRDLDPNRIGAIYDVPNMLRVGLEDSKMGMELLGPYLAHCHIGNGAPVLDGTDKTGAGKWKWVFTGVRDGVADIAGIVQDLKDVGYKGYMSLEEFGPGKDEDKLRDQGAYLRELIGEKDE